MPQIEASDLGMHCLPMLHKKDARLIWVKISIIIEPWHEISNNVVCPNSKGSDQPAHTHRLIRAFTSRLHIL